MKNFTEEKALEDLRRKGIGIEGRYLYLRPGDLGIKQLAKLDYLANHCKYRVIIRKETAHVGK